MANVQMMFEVYKVIAERLSMENYSKVPTDIYAITINNCEKRFNALVNADYDDDDIKIHATLSAALVCLESSAPFKVCAKRDLYRIKLLNGYLEQFAKLDFPEFFVAKKLREVYNNIPWEF